MKTRKYLTNLQENKEDQHEQLLVQYLSFE